MCRSSRAGVGILVVALLASASAWAADEAPPPVRYADGCLTLRVERMQIADVLRRVGDATGAVVRGDVPFGEVTVALENVPLSVALDTILGSHSFMLTYGAHGALRSIDLLGAGPPITPAPGTPKPTPGISLAAEEHQASFLQREVPAWGELQGAFPGPEPLTVGRLLHAVVNDKRQGVRAAAREVVLNAFVEHPEVETAYLSTLTPIDDATLAGMLRASNVDGSAEEWMSALASRARSQELKDKAAAILRELRAPPPQ